MRCAFCPTRQVTMAPPTDSPPTASPLSTAPMLDTNRPTAQPLEAGPLPDPPQRCDDAPLSRDLPESVNWLKGLRCVAAVAAHGSSTRAAQAIHLSQPATTRAVLDLEQRLGLALFERQARGMRVTPWGARVALRAQRLHDALCQGATEALQLAAAGRAPRAAARRSPRPERFAAVVAPASIRALLALASEGSASRAAARLGLSQPAVHRALRVMEDACGAPLCRRTPQGTQLTDSGQALLRRVKLAMAELRALASELAARQGACRGQLVVGTLPLSVQQVLPRAIARLRTQQPGVEVTVVDGTYDSLTRALQSGDVDLIVGGLRPQPPSDLRQEPLFDDELVVVARTGHPCLASPPSLAELLRWPWVLPLPGTPARVALERAFTAAGLPPPRAALQSNSVPFSHSLAAHSDHLTLSARRQVQVERVAGVLGIVPVPLGTLQRTVGLLVRSDAPAPPELQGLITALHAVSADSPL